MEILQKIELRNLVASEGYYLTQVADVADEERIFSTSLWLGINDSESNWRETDVEERYTCYARIAAKKEEQENEVLHD